MGADYEKGPGMFDYQESELTVTPAPNINQWYPIFHELIARVYRLTVGVLLANETLEVRATINGQLIDGAALPANFNANYQIHLLANAITGVSTLEGQLGTITNRSQQAAFLLEGREVLIEMRKTTAAGAGDLRALVMWGQLS